MRIRITGHGIYDGNGEEVPVGKEFEVKDEPKGWDGRYVVLSDGRGKAAVTNPKGEKADKGEKKPEGPAYKAEDRDGVWTIVDGDDNPHGKPLTEDDAKTFNDLNDADKAEFVAGHIKG